MDLILPGASYMHALALPLWGLYYKLSMKLSYMVLFMQYNPSIINIIQYRHSATFKSCQLKLNFDFLLYSNVHNYNY